MAPPAATSAPSTPDQLLVAWTGPVEHLFFHSLIVRPSLAFTKDRLAQGFRDYFVTVGEFRSMLGQLYANRWTLVDIHRAMTGDVLVPPGRRPFVLSEDDVNYYDYSRPRGLGWRLVLDAAGDVKVEIRDDHGIRVTDDDIVPIVDEFVARHPEFSAQGAKGVLAVTGYEGLLGERVNEKSSPDWATRVSRVTAVASRLKATGWVFASHSYGHINFATASLAAATRDIRRWKAEAEPIIGTTDVFVYPFGAEPPVSSATVAMLRANGFTLLCDIDIVPRLVHADGIVLMSRRHIDGLALEQQVKRLVRFFDATQIEDRQARYG
jgi:peptidoglycan/xylan/chitin deacetylase (PgdA/CDA1 family)